MKVATGDCRATSMAIKPAIKDSVRWPGQRRPRVASRQSARKYQYARPTTATVTTIENGLQSQAVRAVWVLKGVGFMPGNVAPRTVWWL